MIDANKYIDEMSKLQSDIPSDVDETNFSFAKALGVIDRMKKLFEKAYYEGWSDALIYRDKLKEKDDDDNSN